MLLVKLIGALTEKYNIVCRAGLNKSLTYRAMLHYYASELQILPYNLGTRTQLY